MSAAVLGAVLSVEAMEGAEAISRLLNLRAAGSDKTYAEAAAVVRAEAARGGALQQYVLALASLAPNAPKEVELDEETRQKYLKNSAKVRKLAEKRNNAMAWYLLSMETDNLGYLKKAADGGNVQALNAWGAYQLSRALGANALTDTNETAQAFAAAFDCFKQATLKKDANGMCNLGMCYMRGYGCERNTILAFGAFRGAADLGHTEAMNDLGGFYRDGIGIECDAVLAAKWFERSARLGNAYGQLNYALALLRGDGESRDEKKGFEYLRKAALQKNVEALKLLSDCYAKGRGVEMNARKALVLMMMSRAVNGDRGAATWLKETGHTNFEEEVTKE